MGKLSTAIVLLVWDGIWADRFDSPTHGAPAGSFAYLNYQRSCMWMGVSQSSARSRYVLHFPPLTVAPISAWPRGVTQLAVWRALLLPPEQDSGKRRRW